VTGSEVVRPEAATLRGLVQVVPQEHPGLRCRGLDVAPRADEPASTVAAAIVGDLGLALEQPLVARRGRQLWVPDHQELPRPSASAGLLRHGGVYLITGGTGAIGRAIARHLATKYNAKIALLSRSGMAADGFLVGAADVADEAALNAFVATVEEKLGSLNGIIHAAGIVGPSARLPFAEASRVDVETLMRAKLAGTRALDRVLVGRSLDFVCLMSSLAVELGGPGLGPYAAANCALDAFAGERSAIPWTAIHWDGWQLDVNGLGIAPDAGVAALEDALALGSSQVTVAVGDFAARLSRWQKPRPAAAAAQTAASPQGSRTEIAVGRAWEAVLGRSNLGAADDFFDLGGDSLRAVQVVNRLRGDLGREIPMRLLFEASTVTAFAGAIDRLLATAELPAAGLEERMEVEF
jgi:NAD(P)-dependent dehydrogenase (short-subunit alcohol dehydrogenase family)/acyl carrier protein